MSADNLDRYVRQTIFPGVGVEGQRRLLAAKAVVIGCGALGSSLANLLARAGIGKLVIVDRDFIELNNLPGLTTSSLLPKELQAAGISFRDFLESQIELARARANVLPNPR